MTTATREEAPRHFSTSVMKSYVFTLCEDIRFHYTFIHYFIRVICTPTPTSRRINHKRKKKIPHCLVILLHKPLDD